MTLSACARAGSAARVATAELWLSSRRCGVGTPERDTWGRSWRCCGGGRRCTRAAEAAGRMRHSAL
eukprot:14042204-Alexandrium_andersonii.AAC.1